MSDTSQASSLFFIAFQSLLKASGSTPSDEHEVTIFVECPAEITASHFEKVLVVEIEDELVIVVYTIACLLVIEWKLGWLG